MGSQVKDLPSIAAMSSAGSMALIPKIIVAAAIAAAVLTTGGLAYKAYVNRDMKMVAAGERRSTIRATVHSSGRSG